MPSGEPSARRREVAITSVLGRCAETQLECPVLSAGIAIWGAPLLAESSYLAMLLWHLGIAATGFALLLYRSDPVGD